jgi:hypothetical protein
VTVYAIAQLKFTEAAFRAWAESPEDRHAGADTVMLLANGLA